MRRLRVHGRALLGAGLAVLTLAGSGGLATAGKTPSRVLVTASEWNFILSQPKLPAGPTILQIYNRGEDPHNLRIRRANGGPVRRIAQQEPGATGQLEFRLKRGKRYRLWCSLPNHRGLGMKATLKVSRKRASG
jgi:Copper binding proteins, plastocyanin/azurin family